MCSDLRPLVFLALAGCGSVVDAAWNGVPLLSIEGTVFADDLDPVEADRLRVAILWSRGSQEDAEQTVVTTTSFPARYRLDVFSPPPQGTLLPFRGDDALRVAMGKPVLYLDQDEDGAWSAEHDRIVGGSFDVLVVFVDPAGVKDGSEWSLRKGFQQMRSTGDPCAEGGDEVLESMSSETDLYVGNLYPYLYDWDCDPNSAEWSWNGNDIGSFGEDCPPPDDLLWFCDRANPSQDEQLTYCLEAYCDGLEWFVAMDQQLATCPAAAQVATECGGSSPSTCAELMCPAITTVANPDLLDRCPDGETMFVLCVDPMYEPIDATDETCMALYCPSVEI